MANGRIRFIIMDTTLHQPVSGVVVDEVDGNNTIIDSETTNSSGVADFNYTGINPTGETHYFHVNAQVAGDEQATISDSVPEVTINYST